MPRCARPCSANCKAMAICNLPYYQMLVTYAFHYMLASFNAPLPWKDRGIKGRRLCEERLRARAVS
eukprot:2772945-Amphidinium_carterae.1